MEREHGMSLARDEFREIRCRCGRSRHDLRKSLRRQVLLQSSAIIIVGRDGVVGVAQATLLGSVPVMLDLVHPH